MSVNSVMAAPSSVTERMRPLSMRIRSLAVATRRVSLGIGMHRNRPGADGKRNGRCAGVDAAVGKRDHGVNRANPDAPVARRVHRIHDPDIGDRGHLVGGETVQPVTRRHPDVPVAIFE